MNNNSNNNHFSHTKLESALTMDFQSSDTIQINDFPNFSNEDCEQRTIESIKIDDNIFMSPSDTIQEKKEKKLKQNLKLNCFVQKKFQVEAHKYSIDSDQSSKSITYNAFNNTDETFTQKIQEYPQQYNQFFEEVEQIGQGFQGVVKKVFHRYLKQYFAAKILRSDDEEIQATANNERNILKQLNHPNILKTYETYSNNNGAEIITVMELFESTTIYQYLKSSPTRPLFDLRTILKIIFELLSTVKYIHDQNFVHRDINSKNVLINKSLDQIKLIDFGVAKSFQTSSIQDDMLIYSPKSGKAKYQAPEVLQNKPYTFSVDVYQIGQLFYEMMCWKLTTSQKIINKIFQNENLFKTGYFKENRQNGKIQDILEPIKKLILQMLEVDPDKRISINEALQNSIFYEFQLDQKNL